MTPDKPELEPCPFCGEHDNLSLERQLSAPNMWFVMCFGCGAKGGYANIETEAIAAWNTRPAPQAGNALAYEIEAAIEAWHDCFPQGQGERTRDDSVEKFNAMAELFYVNSEKITAALRTQPVDATDAEGVENDIAWLRAMAEAWRPDYIAVARRFGAIADQLALAGHRLGYVKWPEAQYRTRTPSPEKAEAIAGEGPTSELVERLLQTSCVQIDPERQAIRPNNPDGPEAAARITALEAQLARQQAAMREAVEALGEANYALNSAKLTMLRTRGSRNPQRDGAIRMVDATLATLTTLLSDAPARGEGEQS